MRKISKWWLLLLLPFVGMCSFVFFIWTFSYDNFPEISRAIFYDKNGLNESVVNAALAVRFPNESDWQDFESFVKKVEGRSNSMYIVYKWHTMYIILD